MSRLFFKILAVLLVDSFYKKTSGLLYFIDFISLSNKSFKSLTCVGKVQCCLESILFQRFDIYFCFPTLNVHPSSMNWKKATRNCAVWRFISCKKLAVSFPWEREDHEYIFCTKIWQAVWFRKRHLKLQLKTFNVAFGVLYPTDGFFTVYQR